MKNYHLLVLNKIITTFFIVLIACSQEAIAADGDLDTTFGNTRVITAIGSGDEYARDVAIQADGKVIAVGSYTVATQSGNQTSIAVTRYNSDGSLDSSFGGGDGIVTTLIEKGSDASGIVIQGDGKIVVVGNSEHEYSPDEVVVLRYASTGALDTTFGGGDGIVTTLVGTCHSFANDVVIQSDGKIVVAGSQYCQSESPTDVPLILRYLSNGSLDTTFGGGDGYINAPIDGSWSRFNSVALQSDGKIVGAGRKWANSTGYSTMARYGTDGTLDATFGGGDGTVTTLIGSGSDAKKVIIQSNGKIVLAGGSSGDFALARYETNGSLDTTFGGGDGIVITPIGTSDDFNWDAAIQSDGKIVTAGYSNDVYGDFALARYDSSGNLDLAFSGDGITTTAVSPYSDEIRALAIQTDGKIVAAGNSHNGSNTDIALIRYNNNGAVDTTFGKGDGYTITAVGPANSYARSVTIQNNDQIIAAGYADNGMAIVRYNLNGSVDETFGGGDGIVSVPANIDGFSAAIQADGKIVVAGESNWNFALVRYESTGNLDTSFGGGDGYVITDFGAIEQVRAVALHANGKISVIGTSDSDFAVARYDNSGTLDVTFGGGDGIITTDIAISTDGASGVVIQNDDKMVLVGSSNSGTGQDVAMVRYESNGSPDTTFGGGDGIVITPVGSSDDAASSVLLQDDGKIVVAGYSKNGSGNWDFMLLRYESTGVLDTTFGGGDGIVTTPIGASHDYAESVAIDCNNSLIVAGRVEMGSSDWDFAVVRYTNIGVADTTFGGGDGIVTTPITSSYDHGFSTALQRDGKIVVAGYSYNPPPYSINAFTVVRYLGSVPPAVPGDTNGDGNTDLTDVILGLQLLSGQEASISPLAVQANDVDGDNRLSIPEILHSIRSAAGL